MLFKYAWLLDRLLNSSLGKARGMRLYFDYQCLCLPLSCGAHASSSAGSGLGRARVQPPPVKICFAGHFETPLRVKHATHRLQVY